MARRKSDSPQKAAMHEMMQGYLEDTDIILLEISLPFISDIYLFSVLNLSCCRNKRVSVWMKDQHVVLHTVV